MLKKVLSLSIISLFVLALFAVPVAAQDDMFDPAALAAELGIEVTGEGIVCPEGDAEVTFAGGSVGNELEMARWAGDIFEEACPNVAVEIVQMPDSATDRLNIYLQEWQAESPNIDVFQVDVIWPAIIAPHVVDMNEYLDEEFIGMLFEDMVEGQTVDGKLVAIPFFADAAGLYYRTDLLEQYGVAVPETWDDLMEAAMTIQEGVREETGNQDFWGFVWQGNDYEGLTCDAHEWLVAETGDSFITADGSVNVNNEQFIDAVARAAEWVGTVSPPGVTTYQEEESRAVFQAGNAAFMRNWPYAYNLGQSEDSAVAGMIDWVPLPTGDARSAACLGGWQIAVSEYSDNIPAAVEFAKYLASPEQQLARAVIQGQLPSMPEVYEHPLAQEDPLLRRAGPILGTAFPRPSVVTGASYNEASAIFSSAIHSVLTGQADVETAIEDLEIELEDFVADLGQ